MSRVKNKIICALLLISVICIPLSIQTAAAAPIVKITSQTISDTGVCEVIGYITDYKPGTMVTFLVTEGTDISKLSADKIIYIWQDETGNNGAFMFRCNIHWMKGGKQAQIRVGNNAGAAVYSSNVTLPPMPPDIGIVDNNSVLFGRDIYYVPGSAYTGDNIAESLTDDSGIKFGTDILYKIGDKWFNLSNAAATSNAYLISSNAIDLTVVESRHPRCYYALTAKITLKYILDDEDNTGSGTVDVPEAGEDFE